MTVPCSGSPLPESGSPKITRSATVCWVGTSWAGWQEHQDHAGCKIMNWSRADGHEHADAPSRRRPMGLDSPTAASMPRSASSPASAPSTSRPRRWPSRSAALPDQTARSGLPSPEDALEPGGCPCDHAAVRLAQVIFPVAQQHPLRFVQRGPPSLLAPFGVASHLDMPPACSPGGGAVARFPGQRHRARLPRVAQAAFSRPRYTSHPVSRTHIRESAGLGAVQSDLSVACDL